MLAAPSAQSAMIEFSPIVVGPFEISRLPVSGVLHAAALIVSIGLAVALARRRALPPSLALEAHVVAVPVALALSRARAVAAALPGVLHDSHALAAVILGPGDALLGFLGAAVVGLLMAWASTRPRDFADSLAPGIALVVGSLLVDPTTTLTVRNAIVTVMSVSGCIAAWRIARARRRPGEAALVAAEASVIALAATFWAREIPSLPVVGCAAALGGLVLAHVALATAEPAAAASQPVRARPSGG